MSTSSVVHPTCYGSDFTNSTSSQLNFLQFLELRRIKPIKTKDCFVIIQGSKCSICKREFKCITDMQKHMQKKHKYIKRKADSKLVRVMFKMGKETFCDHKIYKKYLKAPYLESEEVNNSHADSSVRLQTENYEPVKVSEINCELTQKNPKEDISRDLIAKGSVPLYFALNDIKSLDAIATYKNGRVYKGDPNQYSDIEDKENQTIINDRTCEISATSETFSNHESSVARCASKDRNSVSPTPSNSDSSTILYVSDAEMDFSELYEDVKPRIPKIELADDSDDGEIQVIKTYYKNDFNTVRKSIEETEGIGAALDSETILEINSVEKEQVLKLKLEPVPMDVIQIDDSDIDDAETVVLSNAKGIDDLETRLAELEDVDSDEASFQQSSEDSFMFTVNDLSLQGFEEGDQDVCIIEEVKQLNQMPDLAEYLEEAVLKYVEECEAASTVAFNDRNNNDKVSTLGEDLKNRQSRIDKVKISSSYNRHLRLALQNLGITITPPSLIKEEI